MIKSTKLNMRYLSMFLTLALLFGVIPTTIQAGAAGKSVITQVKQIGTKKIVKVTFKKVSGVNKYVVYRSTKKSTGYKKITSLTGNKNKYIYKDTTVKYGRKYYYKIKAQGLKYSKILSVTVKNASSANKNQSSINTSAPTILDSTIASTAPTAVTTPAAESYSPVDTPVPPASESKSPEPIVSAGPVSTIPPIIEPDPDATPTPVPTIDPESVIDTSSLGTEGIDYYIIDSANNTDGISKVADIDNGVVNVKSSAIIVLQGELNNYSIQCSSDNINVQLLLSDARITNTDRSFVYNDKSSSEIMISALGDSENEIIAAKDYTGTNEIICSQGKVTLSGGGTIKINSMAAGINAVKSETSVELKSGIVNIDSLGKGIVGKPVLFEGSLVNIVSTDDGIKGKGKNGVIVSGGTLDVKSEKDGISANKHVGVTGGYISINALDDAIQAGDGSFDESAQDFTIDEGIVSVSGGTIVSTSGGCGLKANASVNIEAGNITIASGGKGIKSGNTYKYPEDSASPAYTKSQSGYVSITGGVININSGDHAISANGNLVSGSADDNDNAITISNASITLKASATLKSSQKTGDMMGGGARTVYDAEGGDGINSNSGIYIENSSIKVSGSADAIQAESNLTINNTNLDLYAYGKGLKCGYIVDKSYYGLMNVEGGTIKIVAYDDAVHCNNNISILKGTLILSTNDDGVHADNDLSIGKEGSSDSELSITVAPIKDGDVSITPYEGIEAAYIYIYSGKIELDTSDDGINAAGGVDSSGSNTGTTNTNDNFGPGGMFGGGGRPGGNGGGMMSDSYGEIYIYGGDLHVDADGDSLDANGKITITGGKILIDGSANGSDDVLDYDSGCYINGGEVIAVGKKGVSTEGGSAQSTQYNVLFKSSSQTSAGADYELKDSENNVILAGTTKKATNVYFFTTGQFADNKTYSLYIDGVKKGEVTFNTTEKCKTISM